MKTKLNCIKSALMVLARVICVACAAAVTLIPSIAFTQNWAIDWHTVDGGATTSSGGVFTISGTIGQPDAGRSTGGLFAMEGGFWSFFDSESLDVPMLQILPTGSGTATISWTPNPPGWTLQYAATLSSPAWTNAPSGTNNPATIPGNRPAGFYRLRRN